MPRITPHVAAAFLLLSQSACLDSVEPVGAQTAELQAIQAALRQVLERLDTLEAREGRRAQDAMTRLDSLDARGGRRGIDILAGLDTLLLAVGNPGDPGSLQRVVLDRLDSLDARQERRSTLALERFDTLDTRSGAAIAELDTLTRFVMQPNDPGSIGVQLEAQLCFERSRKLTGEAESKVQVDGQGTGTVGVDAEGNGAKGMVNGTARQVVQLKPSAEWDFKSTICGKGYGERDLGSLRDIVTGLLDAVTGSALATAATSTDMTGTRMSTSLNSVAGLSMSQFGFGAGGAADLVNSLPLPSDLADLLQNPAGILQRAAEAGQYAIDQLCSQTLFTGSFAERASAACDLRDELNVGQVVTLLQNLGSLPGAVSGLESGLASLGSTVTGISNDVTSACNTLNSMRVKNLSIPSYRVTILSTEYTVFPGYNQPLFPGLAAAC
ncbi:MAG TPA: hypothetical protein VD793_06845 [Gemmatimonadales bacterium]|nr:hypothetical protein [Gemmatimonadales bacterium]